MFIFNYINAPVKFQDEENIKLNKLKLTNVIGKATYYNVVLGQNDNFTFYEDTSTLLTCTITPGNYNSYTLCDEINTKMDAISTSSGSGYTYTVSCDAVKFLTTITSNGTSTKINVSGYDLAYMLGFHVDSADSNTIISDSCFNMLTNYLEIRISNLNNTFQYVDSEKYNYISFYMPIYYSAGLLICWEPKDQYIYSDRLFSIDGLKVEIRNEYGELVNNRGGLIKILFNGEINKIEKKEWF